MVLFSYKDQEGLDAVQLYFAMMKDIAGVECPNDTFPAASWYHLCMGYDAGYYGYLWSEVYAADLFKTFQTNEGGCMCPTMGRAYRDAILAPCAAEDGMTMLKTFLKREPSATPFLERIGVA